MSEEEDPIDLSARDLMAGWLDDLENPEKIQKKYADHEGGDGKRGRGKGGQQGGGRGGSSFGDRGRPGGGGGRGPGGGGGGQRDRDGKGRGRGPRQGGRDGERGRGRDRRGDERRPAPPARIEGIDVVLLPEKSAIESIAKYVRMTGRAYPMWDIARTMLGARERYRIGFRKSREAGEAAPDLMRCSLDDSLWLNWEEALQHVVRSGLLSNYYRTEEVEVEPPKGNFTVIAKNTTSKTRVNFWIDHGRHHQLSTSESRIGILPVPLLPRAKRANLSRFINHQPILPWKFWKNLSSSPFPRAYPR